jgi:hypothetical protein
MRDHLRYVAVLVVVLMVGAAAAAWSADEAAMEATNQEVTEVSVNPLLLQGVTENAKGTVYYYDERRPEVWATIGLRNGLRPSAVVAFVRCGEVVAQGIVVQAKTSDCIIRPAPCVPAGTILVGDDVRVLVNGSREALDAVIAREDSDRALGTFAIFAILFGSIWAERY